MKIKIPPSGVDGDSMFAAAFCVAIFSTIAPLTLLRTIPRALRAATLPFWIGGGIIGKRNFVDPYIYTKFTVGKDTWSIKRKLLGISVKKIKGRTTDLKSAVCDIGGFIEEAPKHQLKLLLENRKDASFGIELSDRELQVLAEEINNHLAKLKAINNGDFPLN
jgi:hypothetical protein